MIIAVNAIFFSKENESDFFRKVIDSIATTYPKDTFLLITTDESEKEMLPNVTAIHPGLPPSSANRWFFWMHYKVKQILKKHQPDLLINNGEGLFHFKKVPQILFNPDLRFVQDPKTLPSGLRRIYDFFAARSYQKAQSLIVFSEVEKNILKSRFRIQEQKINVIRYGAPGNLKPIDDGERETIKDKYARGYEYFLQVGFIGQSDHLVNLLKSFSAFKKRQRSSMQLLLMGAEGVHFDTFQKALHLYKYKEDVHIINGVKLLEAQRIIASAYALIFSYKFDHRSHLLLTALKYEVPSIVPDAGSLSEAGIDAVLSFEAGNNADLAGKMMHLFKDEKSRKKLIENSRSRIHKRSFENSVKDTWEIMSEKLN